jgi:hypothetical protein
MGYESLPGGSSPRGSCLEIETGDVGEEKERRQRRRNNNRESAKRVKEKRDADLKEANKKVTPHLPIPSCFSPGDFIFLCFIVRVNAVIRFILFYAILCKQNPVLCENSESAYRVNK